MSGARTCGKRGNYASWNGAGSGGIRLDIRQNSADVHGSEVPQLPQSHDVFSGRWSPTPKFRVGHRTVTPVRLLRGALGLPGRRMADLEAIAAAVVVSQMPSGTVIKTPYAPDFLLEGGTSEAGPL
ncbi:hypothetical protein Acy02nite_90810 [Actinoplanes cyaneus]|uniref:Uncharacterized protein n=1 Tax=Actinoplanes cyaneus TaxID=52696 RepID=A0A919IZZ6_9ACTN|nr:hypothetical protein Acy02nite_90810 [Actinoplanes cyaneus]